MSDAVKCTRCGTTNRANQYFCSSCGLNLHAEGGSRRVDQESESSTSATESGERAPVNLRSMVAALAVRYRDAYIVAGTIIVFGTAVKIVGWVLGVVIFLVSLGATDDLGWRAPVGGLILGAVTGVMIHMRGILVSAQSQILRAILDTAVNTSPFLGDEQRIGILKE